MIYSVGSIQSINGGRQQANEITNQTNQTGTALTVSNTPAHASHVFLGVLNNQGNGRVDAWRADALSPLLMRLVALLNNEQHTAQQRDNSHTNQAGAQESPIATHIGDGFQQRLVDSTPFTSSTGVVNPANANGASTALSASNTNRTNRQVNSATPFGSPIAAQVGSGFQSLLGGVNTSPTATNNEVTVNPSHWRRGSSGLRF